MLWHLQVMAEALVIDSQDTEGLDTTCCALSCSVLVPMSMPYSSV